MSTANPTLARYPQPAMPLVRAAQAIVSFPALLCTSLMVAIFYRVRFSLSDPDTWWHAAVGERILASSSFPTVDTYSYTAAGQHWMAYEWLGEVLSATAARLGGIRGMTILLAVLGAVFMLLLFELGRRRSGNSKAAFVACVLMLPLAGSFFTLRPQLLGYIFLLCTLIILEASRRGPRALLFLPPLFLVWVNTHGTFVFGLLALGIHYAGGLLRIDRPHLSAERWPASQRLRVAGIILLCVLALLITPYGSRLAAYPLELALSQPVNIASIQEWQPMPFDSAFGRFFLVVVIAFVVLQLLKPLRYAASEIALLLFAAYAACVHRRFALLFIVAFAPVLARMLANWVPPYDRAKDRYALNAALMAVMALAVARFFPSAVEIQNHVAQQYPQAAVEYIRRNIPTGRMLNEYGWGGYLIWTSQQPGAPHPWRHPVFIDGRADIYEYRGVLADYQRITQLAAPAQSLLAKYDVTFCLLQRHAPLATLLSALPEWEKVYSDDLSVVFVRRQPSAALASQQTP